MMFAFSSETLFAGVIFLLPIACLLAFIILASIYFSRKRKNENSPEGKSDLKGLRVAIEVVGAVFLVSVIVIIVFFVLLMQAVTNM